MAHSAERFHQPVILIPSWLPFIMLPSTLLRNGPLACNGCSSRLCAGIGPCRVTRPLGTYTGSSPSRQGAMAMTPTHTRQLHSTVHQDSTVTLALVEADLPAPGPDDVVVRIEAAPINPSDVGIMFARAHLGATPLAPAPRVPPPAVRATLSPEAMQAAAGRIGLTIPAGDEGGGIVVVAGASDAAQALLGKVVGMRGGAMYAQYRCIAAPHCLVLPDGTAPMDAAACFVNPLTALGMVETMWMEGHTGLVHTAAASNLGHMLQKICTADGIPLGNIVATAG